MRAVGPGAVALRIRAGWSSTAVRFLAVGVAAAVVDIALLALQHELLRVPVVIATPIAFTVSFVITFLLQRSVTFRSDAPVGRSALRYTLLVLANVVAVTAIVSGAEAIGLPWLVGKVASLAASAAWNFVLYRVWVFRPVA